MGTIVLVHGAWGGSYGFAKVRSLLTAQGHDVFTPSLTGIGERSHLTGEHVRLETHLRDVYNTIFYEDLDEIVLLGFSYGGMVVTGLLNAIGSRVNHLVYLDALVPADGQSAAELIGPGALELIANAEAGLIPPIPRELDTPEATEWSNERRVGQPVGTFTEPVSLAEPLEDWAFTRTFIKATADTNEPDDSAFWTAARYAQDSPHWNYHEIPSTHMVPLTHPQELATILNDLANTPPVVIDWKRN